jgi:hypothetical protein
LSSKNAKVAKAAKKKSGKTTIFMQLDNYQIVDSLFFFLKTQATTLFEGRQMIARLRPCFSAASSLVSAALRKSSRRLLQRTEEAAPNFFLLIHNTSSFYILM